MIFGELWLVYFNITLGELKGPSVIVWCILLGREGPTGT